jgi:hypothetical protein
VTCGERLNVLMHPAWRTATCSETVDQWVLISTARRGLDPSFHGASPRSGMTPIVPGSPARARIRVVPVVDTHKRQRSHLARDLGRMLCRAPIHDADRAVTDGALDDKCPVAQCGR